jgi:hypothetical protein
MLPFLKAEYRKEMSISTKLKRIDWLGNLVLVSSIVAVLFALSFAGTLYPWSSWRVNLPLVLGFIGLMAFLLLQTLTPPCTAEEKLLRSIWSSVRVIIEQDIGRESHFRQLGGDSILATQAVSMERGLRLATASLCKTYSLLLLPILRLK